MRLICHTKGDELLFLHNDYITCPVEVPLTVSSVEENNDLQTFFNATTQIIEVNWQQPLQQEGKVEIYNLLGQQVARSEVAAGAQTATMNVPALPAGIYLVTLQNNEQLIGQSKLLITR